MRDDMSIELATQNYITALTGGNNAANASNTETDEKDDRFAQYLVAIKNAKLSETQLQKLSESRADDERTRTIEQLDRKAKADDEHYDKMRANGYTVGETRRGVDQTDRAIERQAADARRDAAHEKSLQTAESLQGDGRNSFAAESHSTSGNATIVTTEAFPFSTTGTIPGTSDATINANTSLSQMQAAQEIATNASPTDAAQIRQNSNAENNVSSNTGHGTGNAEQLVDAKHADVVAEQSTQQQAIKAGKSVAASLAGVMAGMSPVSRNANTKSDMEIDAKNTTTIGQSGETKESMQNSLTREALTAASETQQTANDPGLSGQANRQQDSQQTPSGDTTTSQTLPSTSLMERIDQAKLTNRVTSAFRSLANQSGTIRMKLHPEELGALTIRMQIESGKVSAKLETETEAARQVLSENIDSLKRKLKEQNLEVSSFEIEVVSEKGSRQTSAAKLNANDRSVMQTKTAAIDRKNKDETESRRQEPDHVDLYS